MRSEGSANRRRRAGVPAISHTTPKQGVAGFFFVLHQVHNRRHTPTSPQKKGRQRQLEGRRENGAVVAGKGLKKLRRRGGSAEVRRPEDVQGGEGNERYSFLKVYREPKGAYYTGDLATFEVRAGLRRRRRMRESEL